MTTPAEPEVSRLAGQMRARLISLDAATASEMIDAYGKVWLRVKAEVDGLFLEAAHNKLTAEKVQRLGQMRKITRMVSDELDHFAGVAGTRITEAQAQAVNMARENTRRMVDAALPPGIDTALLEGTAVQWTVLHREAFSMFVGMAGNGGPLARLLDAIGPDVAASVREAISSGIAQGWSPRFTATVVRQKVGMGLTRALTISRTETLRAYREANRLQYTANSHIVKGFRRVSARDDRVCMACAVLDGEVYETSELGYYHIACRCGMSPITVTYKELGIPIEEPPEKTTTTQDWFLHQDEATQRAMLGDAKYEAWRGGKFELSDIPKRIHNDTWGDSFVEKTLEELLR